jgi:hypothetical protein
MTPEDADRFAEVLTPLVALRADALAEANRTGRPVVVDVPGGHLTVQPDAHVALLDAAS